MKIDINQWGKLARIERKFTRHNLQIINKILVRFADECPQLEDALASYIDFQMKNEKLLMEKAKNLNLVCNHLFERLISEGRELNIELKEKAKIINEYVKDKQKLHLFGEYASEEKFEEEVVKYLNLPEYPKDNYVNKLKEVEKAQEKIKNDEYEILKLLFSELIDEESNYYQDSIEKLNQITNLNEIDDPYVMIPQISMMKIPNQLELNTIESPTPFIQSEFIEDKSKITVFKKADIQDQSQNILENMLIDIRDAKTQNDVATIIKTAEYEITNRFSGPKINLDMLFFARQFQGVEEPVNQEFLVEIEKKIDNWKLHVP